MTSEKKPRVMTLKGFVNKASSAKSAMGFLSAHSDFIKAQGSLAPLLAKYEEGKEIASNTLIIIRDLAFAKMVDEEIENARTRSTNVRVKKAQNYIVTIYHTDKTAGKSAGFEMMQEAERWADRRLFEDASTSHAQVSSIHVGKSGNPIEWDIPRQDSFARVMKENKGPVMKSASKTTSSLSFGCKVHNDRASFSRG